MTPHRHNSLATALRVTVGLVWLAGAVFNAFWTLRQPSVITDSLATEATFRVYRWFFGGVVAPAPRFWIILLVLCELGLGLLTLGRDRWARAGLAGSAVFSAFLFFVIWPYTLMMGVYALLPAWLLRFPHQRSIVDLFRRQDGAGLHVTGSGA